MIDNMTKSIKDYKKQFSAEVKSKRLATVDDAMIEGVEVSCSNLVERLHTKGYKNPGDKVLDMLLIGEYGKKLDTLYNSDIPLFNREAQDG